MFFRHVLCALAWLAVFSGTGTAAQTNYLTAYLLDGSILIGQSTTTTLPIESSIIGKLEIQLSRASRIAFKKDHTVSILLLNGDKIEGTLNLPALKLTTSIGPVSIPRDVLQNVEISSSYPELTTQDLLFHFPLDENDPGKIRDHGPFGLKSINHGAVPIRACCEFSGNNYIDVPYDKNFALAPNDPFTLCAWVRPAIQPGHFQAIAVTALANAGFEWEWGLYVDQTGHFMSGWTATVTVTSKSVIDGNHWYHLAVTYSEGQWVLYVNGVAEAENKIKRVLETQGGFAIGRKGESSAVTDDYHGMIRDVRLYKRALSAEKIKSLHDSTAPQNPPTLPSADIQ